MEHSHNTKKGFRTMSGSCNHPESRQTVQVQGFTGCVVVAGHWKDHDERAHGGITLVATCECGKRRRENQNNVFSEHGQWHHPPQRQQQKHTHQVPTR